MCVCVRERDRQTDRQTARERQTDRQTEKERLELVLSFPCDVEEERGGGEGGLQQTQ